MKKKVLEKISADLNKIAESLGVVIRKLAKEVEKERLENIFSLQDSIRKRVQKKGGGNE